MGLLNLPPVKLSLATETMAAACAKEKETRLGERITVCNFTTQNLGAITEITNIMEVTAVERIT